MRKQLFQSAVIAIIMSGVMGSTIMPLTPASAQTSDERRNMDAIKRVKQGLDQAEKNIDRIKPSTSERSLANIAERIDRAEIQLKKLSSSTDGYPAQETRIRDLRDRLATAQQSFSNTFSNREGDRELLEQLQAEGKTAEDDKLVREATTLAQNMKFMDFEHSHLTREESPRLEYIHYASHFPPTLNRINELLSVYGNMDPRDVRQFSGPSLSMLVQEGGPEFKLASEKLATFGAPAIRAAKQKLDAAYVEASSSIQDGRPADILDNDTIYGALHYLEHVSAIYRSRPDAEQRLVEQYDQLEARAESDVRGLISQAMSEIVKNNKPVANQFSDPDRAEIDKMIRERWASAYPADKILQVRIPQSDWVRRREPGWRDGYLIMFDYSTVTPYVVVKEADGMASEWGMVAEKDHTLDDEISVSFGRLRSDKLDPRFTVLESALD